MKNIGWNSLRVFALPVVLLIATPSQAWAQAEPLPSAEPKGNNVIVVTGSRQSFVLASKQLRAAAKAVRKYGLRYAPKGKAFIEVIAMDPEHAIDGLELWVESEERSIALVLDSQNRFELPLLEKGDWQLRSSQPRMPFKMRAWIYSPKSQFGDWRFGDFQLQCRVGWAMARQSVSVVLKGMFDVAGGCGSSRISLMFALGKPIKLALIGEGGKSEELEFEAPDLVRFPTYLKEYGNEARVTVTFEH